MPLIFNQILLLFASVSEEVIWKHYSLSVIEEEQGGEQHSKIIE